MVDKKKLSGWLGKGLGIALLAAAGALLFLYTPPEPEPRPPLVRPAKVLVIQTPEELANRRYPGRTQATERVDLSFRVNGPLILFPVKSGDTVEKGELIAQIDPRDFETSLSRITATLEQEQAKLDSMRVARPEDIAIRQSELNSAQASQQEAENDYQREKNLMERGAGTQRDLDRAREKMDVAKANVKSAEEALGRAQSGARPEDIRSQEALIQGLVASQREAQDALDDTRLEAPFAGRIARTYVENFEQVREKQPIVSLQDISQIEIVADIPQIVVASFDKEHVETTEASFDFLADRAFTVELEEVETEADPRTQTYAVTFTMPAPTDVRILPGMSGTVQMKLKEGTGVGRRWPVPADAVFTGEGDDFYVWKVDQASWSVHRTKVGSGEVRGDDMMVSEGLESGDMIVVAGVHHLEEGQKIRRLALRGELSE